MLFARWDNRAKQRLEKSELKVNKKGGESVRSTGTTAITYIYIYTFVVKNPIRARVCTETRAYSTDPASRLNSCALSVAYAAS